MACDETRSGRIDRANGGERKIASASGIPTTMLSRNPSMISTVVIQPCTRRSDAFAVIETAMMLGGGSRNAGIPNARVPASHSTSSAITTPVGASTAETRARVARSARRRSTLASTSSRWGGATTLAAACSLPPCGGGLGRGVVAVFGVLTIRLRPPPPTPPHRKSGLPDLRTMMRNPGEPGFRGEGSTPRSRLALAHDQAQCSRSTPRARKRSRISRQ